MTTPFICTPRAAIPRSGSGATINMAKHVSTGRVTSKSSLKQRNNRFLRQDLANFGQDIAQQYARLSAGPRRLLPAVCAWRYRRRPIQSDGRDRRAVVVSNRERKGVARLFSSKKGPSRASASTHFHSLLHSFRAYRRLVSGHNGPAVSSRSWPAWMAVRMIFSTTPAKSVPNAWETVLSA